MSRWESAIVALMLGGALMAEHPAGASLRLASALGKLRDVETGRHMVHVAKYARIAATGIDDPEMTPEYLEALELIVSAHDIGKIGIADEILLKPGNLTRGEMFVIQGHAAAGAAIVEDLVIDLQLEHWSFVSMLRAVVRHHHERCDGSGYPDRLRGKQIPFAARITAVADVFDALVTGRPYKRAWTAQEAMGYLSRHAGSQFDETCVRAFLHRADEIVSAHRLFQDPSSSSKDRA